MLGKNLKAGTSSRRENLEGPSCWLGSTVTFPRWGSASEAEAGLKIRLVPPFPALRQWYPWHRAGVALRGTTRFPSASPGIREPPKALPLCRGRPSIPGEPRCCGRARRGVAYRGTRTARGMGPAGRCCIYFLLLVHFGFCVGGSCEQKGDGESIVREQPVLSNT